MDLRKGDFVQLRDRPNVIWEVVIPKSVEMHLPSVGCKVALAPPDHRWSKPAWSRVLFTWMHNDLVPLSEMEVIALAASG